MTEIALDRPSGSANLRAGVLAGLIAGAVFLVLEMALVALSGESPWGPPRMIAAIAMGKGVLPPPATFDLPIVLAAMAVHFALSIVTGAAFALLARRFGMLASMAAGVAVGLAIYVVGFYLLTPIFPWFAMGRGTISIIAHIAFGAVLGLSYRRLVR